MIEKALAVSVVFSVVSFGMEEGLLKLDYTYESRSGVLERIGSMRGGQEDLIPELRVLREEEGSNTIDGPRNRIARETDGIGSILNIEESHEIDYLEGEKGILGVFYESQRRLRFVEPIMLNIE